jgi:hypothetical protein
MTEELRKSFIILTRIRNELKNAEDALSYLVMQKMNVYNSSKDDKEISHINTCMYGLIYFSLIRYRSFLEEYHEKFNSSVNDDKEKIRGIKDRCKIYIKNVEEIFGDIREGRNLLAHTYRRNSQPLENGEINEVFNRLFSHTTIHPYTQFSNTAGLLLQEIEKAYGALSDDEIDLSEPVEDDLLEEDIE